jgi:hypothetical protein
MADSPKPARELIAGDASRLAFRIGQAVQQVLVDRAFELAGRGTAEGDDTLVTVEHVQRVLEESIVREACIRIGVEFDGQSPRAVA